MIYLLFIFEHLFFVVRGFSFVPLAPVYPPGQMPDFEVLSPETEQCEFMALDFEPYEYDVRKLFEKLLYINFRDSTSQLNLSEIGIGRLCP